MNLINSGTILEAVNRLNGWLVKLGLPQFDPVSSAVGILKHWYIFYEAYGYLGAAHWAQMVASASGSQYHTHYL